jgi:hypothetical protein
VIVNAAHISSISQWSSAFGSLPDGTVVSSKSARYQSARTGQIVEL